MNSFNSNSANRDKKTVLVVDEDLAMLDFLSNRCRSIGLNVHAAGDAMSAINIMDEGFPDLMILDVDLPGGKGRLFLDVIDGMESINHIPAIVLSKRHDLNSIYRVQSMIAYYVHKSPQAWNKIRTYTYELVDLASDCDSESATMNNFTSDNS